MYTSFRQNMFYFERVTIVADFKHASLLKINSEINCIINFSNNFIINFPLIVKKYV